MEEIKKKLHSTFKLGGFTVRRQFCSMIVDKFLENEVDLRDRSTFDDMVKKLCGSLEKQCTTEQSIEQEHIERAIESCLHLGGDQYETEFNVIDAFDFPKLSYNPDRRQYYIEKNKSKLLSDADTKAKLHFERYSTVLQRTQRNFAQKIPGKNTLKLETVAYLLTLSSVTLEHSLVLGALFEAKEGKYFLEDNTGMVELDLTHATYHLGFFVENCLVLVNGYYEDKVLHVSTMVLPPGEEYEKSRPTFGNINYFGGLSNVPLRDSQRLEEQMRSQDKEILFFSDVWLDHPMIFDKLQFLFEGLKNSPPVAFVFMGNFTSNSLGSEMINNLKKLFKKFAELASKYLSLVERSHFVFVPNLEDPCTPHIVPRLPLPDYVTADVKKALPKAIFTTNPCRIQYCTREIVVFRSDITSKFLQSTLFKPSIEEIGEFVKRTIISQGHLTPFSLNVAPVHWDFDYCSRLYPLPNLIMIGDKTDSYQGTYKGCQVCTLGPFCEKDFQFKLYHPLSDTLSNCDLEVE